MELIDRQEAIKAIDDVLMEDEQYKVWLKLGINNLKPVDAIPIDWILNYSETIVNPKASTFVVNGLISDGIKKMVVLYLKQMKKEQNNGN